MSGRRRNRVALAFAASFLATALSAAPALAGDSGVGVLFFGLGSHAKIHGLQLEATDGGLELDPLKGKNFRLENGGTLAGGGFQINGFIHGVRTGLGLNVFSVQDTKLRHDALDNNFAVAASGAWGAGLDLFVGYELLHGPVRPYVDLVGGFSGVNLTVDLIHPEFGRLGRTQYGGWRFGFGPRAGLSVPLGKTAFLDLSGTYSVIGMERFRVVGGIGFWSR